MITESVGSMKGEHKNIGKSFLVTQVVIPKRIVSRKQDTNIMIMHFLTNSGCLNFVSMGLITTMSLEKDIKQSIIGDKMLKYSDNPKARKHQLLNLKFNSLKIKLF